MAEIRRATPADAVHLAQLRYEFRAALNNPVEDREHFIARCAAWMAERLDEGSKWRCWVAEAGGAIHGHLWLQLIEKVPNPVPERELHGYITNVYVQPEARGEGPVRCCWKPRWPTAAKQASTRSFSGRLSEASRCTRATASTSRET